LYEREEVNPWSGIAKRVKNGLGVVHELVTFSIYKSCPDQSSVYMKFLVANPQETTHVSRASAKESKFIFLTARRSRHEIRDYLR